MGIKVNFSAKITVNGKEYANVEAMPADVRSLYEQAMRTVAANRNGVPDVIEAGAQSEAAPGSAQSAGQGLLLQAKKPRGYDGGGAPARRRISAALIVFVLGLVLALALAVLLVVAMRTRHGAP